MEPGLAVCNGRGGAGQGGQQQSAGRQEPSERAALHHEVLKGILLLYLHFLLEMYCGRKREAWLPVVGSSLI